MKGTTDFCPRRYTLEMEYLFCKGWGDVGLYKVSEGFAKERSAPLDSTYRNVFENI